MRTNQEKIADNEHLIIHVKNETIKVNKLIKQTNDFHQVKIYEREIFINNRLISDLETENELLGL